MEAAAARWARTTDTVILLVTVPSVVSHVADALVVVERVPTGSLHTEAFHRADVVRDRSLKTPL